MIDMSAFTRLSLVLLEMCTFRTLITSLEKIGLNTKLTQSCPH
jgi:hypothetical protein